LAWKPYAKKNERDLAIIGRITEGLILEIWGVKWGTDD
jgi:hypothetical protein